MENFMSIGVQLEMVLRLFTAIICGALIGYERKNRLKEAGIRTHVIVCVASALIMIISKYGFYDVLSCQGFKLDPSRVAAQIVSGIGFLGAGMIFIRGQLVNGLTTAAGIWATAGVGMALGAGVYTLGLCTTFFILGIQIVFHKDFLAKRIPVSEVLGLRFPDDGKAITDIEKRIEGSGIEVISAKFERIDKGMIMAEMYIKLPSKSQKLKIAELFQDACYIESIDI